MRRAISPATCTEVMSVPSAVFSHTALRSFSVEALSRSALTNLPGKYQTCCTVPSTGLRLECTLNTFMNTLTLMATRCTYGSLVRSTATMRPSAGDSTAPASCGTSRAGSRKNCSTNSAMIHNGIDQVAHQTVAAIANIVETARNGQPSRAMMGWG